MEDKQKGPETEEKTPDTKVYRITDINLNIEKKRPPILVIKVAGQSRSGGGLEGRLQPYVYVQPPADGIWEFDFMAVSPEGYATHADDEVTAEYRWDDFPKELKGVKIYAETNEQTQLLAATSGNAEGKCSDWAAWHDFMPGSKPTLYVTGKCEFPTGGYTVALKPRSPQGINPQIYMLDKVVTAPTGKVSKKTATVEVRYEEDTDFRYSQVHILPDDILLDVQETS